MQLLRRKNVEASIADSHDPDRMLRRDLTVWDLAIMGIAVAVGAGIFSVGARQAATSAGPSVILSFVIAAAVCGLAAMCYAEFASSVPVAGSAYTFSYASMGEFIGWIIGWDLILEMLVAGSVVSKYWGVYLADAFSIFGVKMPTEFQLGPLTVTWGPILIIGVFTTLLVLGTKLSNRVNSVFTVIKVAVVVFVIVVGAFHINAANYSPFIPPAQAASGEGAVLEQTLIAFMSGASPTTYGIFGMLASAGVVFFAFLGFDVVATAAEETRNPRKSLPWGILAGLGIVTVLYVGVALVVTGMVPYTELAKVEHPSLTSTFEMVGLNWAGGIISVGALAGMTTVIMVLLLGVTRVVFAISRDGLLPRGLSRTNARWNTPARLQILVGVVMAIIAGLTDIGVLEEMVNIGTLSAFLLVCFGVPVLRRRRPDLHRAFKVPFSPVLPIVAGLACIWLMLNLTTLTWLRFAVWLVIGFAIYFGYGYWHSRLQTGEQQADVAIPRGVTVDAPVD